LPPLGQPVLIRVPTAPLRQGARAELRAALRGVLKAWSGLPSGQLPLRETPRGPVWPGLLAGHSLDISLAYGGDEGWLGLSRGGSIGLDVMPLKPVAEAEEVARHYLGPAALAVMRQSRQPARAFALAWTDLEARLKCLKRGLSEWSALLAADLAECASRSFVLADRVVVAVATRSESLRERP